MISEDLKSSVLDYEDLLVDIEKRRNPPSKKRWWEGAGVLPSLTAVLTVALTSLAAYFTQRSMKEQDFLTQQSKVNYESITSVVSQAYLLANEALHWAGERDRLQWGDYRNFSPTQKISLVDSVNAADTRWRRGRAVQRVGLSLLFGSGTEVLAAWDTTVARLNAYTSCTVVRPNCSGLRRPAERAIGTFSDAAIADVRLARPNVVRR
jgi:hypothetical protein